MVRIKLPYVSAEVSRHGKSFYYFRKRGAPRKIRLPGKPGDADFMAAYHACLAGQPLPVQRHAPEIRQIVPVTDRKSLRWLCQQYLTSRCFQDLDIKTRRPRQSILNQLCELPISETNRQKMGEAPFEELHAKAIRRIRDRKAHTPEAANNWVKSIKALFKWAVYEEFCTQNPAKDVPKIRVATRGFHTWTIEEVEQFEATYAIGTRPRLALALLLFTGCRRADAVTFGPQHIKDDWLTYTQDKNEHTNPVTLCLPVLPILAEIIAATPSGHLTFLVSEYGKPYTVEGFGKRWRKWATAAGLPHCTPHGLRKAGAARAAENGATTSQLMAIFGWRDIKQAELYTRRASQKALAADGMKTIIAGNKTRSNVSNFSVQAQKKLDTKG
jgi:integrase